MPAAGIFYDAPLRENSEGVKGALGGMAGFRGSDAAAMYALDYDGRARARPSSAPASRGAAFTATGSLGAYVAPRRPEYTDTELRSAYAYPGYPKPRAPPYASRTVQVYKNVAIGRPTVAHAGRSIGIPHYESLNDVHMHEYFERRFCNCTAMPKRPRSPRHGPGSKQAVKSRRNSESEVTYRVAVTTGMFKNCGTAAKVYLRMKGTKGKTPKKLLAKKGKSATGQKKSSPFVFEPGTTNYFKIRGADIGNIESIIVEHDGLTKKAAWYLEQVAVTNVDTGRSWLFGCHQWLSLHHGDCQTSRKLAAKPNQTTEYEVVVVTGDKPMSGTDANVFITVFGQHGQTPKMALKGDKKKLFEVGQSDIFNLSAPSVGPMTKIRIEHDNTGPTPGWFLERVVVTDKIHSNWKYYFPCGRWLARDEDDGAICRDLLGSTDPFAVAKLTKYKVTVYTGDKPGAGTDANVYITMFGELGDSSERRLMKKTRNNFERGQTDDFTLESPSLGRLQRLRIGHDNTGASPGWFLKKVIVDDLDQGAVYEFPCDKWFAVDEGDGQIARELLVGTGAVQSLTGVPYEIHVTTGDVRNAGTDARVYIVLYGGKKGEESSGKVWLEKGKFERGRTDIFHVGIASMLSPLSRIDIGHDNSGPSAGWHLGKVVVICPRVGMEQHFLANRWLAVDEGDGRIECTLFEEVSLRKARESKNSWNVVVYTSDLRGAGTDANVYLVAYGEKGKTDEVWLKNESNNFESGQTDEFKVDLVDIGKPYKIRVGHDNSSPAAAWHLDRIEMENLHTQRRYLFRCNRWLARDEDDGEIVRELPAEGADIEKPLPVVKYTVQVQTGNKRSAGTDANVFVNIFGQLGDTGERTLWKSQSNANKFERGSLDVFSIEAVRLKKLSKIRIGHDGKGAGAGWFLEKVVIKEEGAEGPSTTFECNRWLDINEDDGAIVREITAGGSQMLATTTYNVTVKTGDVRNAGTDANVHLKIFGEAGDTGELALRSSENAKDKFERGRADLFKVEAVDIGKITKIRFGHDGTGPGAGWFVDDLCIDVPSRGERYRFALHRWLAVDEGDGLLELELQPTEFVEIEKAIPYEITVWTSELRGAGTDASVFIQMYGVDGKTEEYKLRNKTDNFESGQVDKFKLEAADVGPLQKIRIGHDGAGLQSGWHLDKVLVQRHPSLKSKKLLSSKKPRKRRTDADADAYDSDDTLAGRDRPSFHLGNSKRGRDSPANRGSPKPQRQKSGERQKDGERSSSATGKRSSDDRLDEIEEYWFICKRWFARDEDDKKIVREIVATDADGKPLEGGLKEIEYTVKVKTGDLLGAGTDANVFVTITGDKGDTGERQLQDSNNKNKFEQAQEDIFKINAVDLGKLTKLKIWHDNKGGGGAWFLDYVEVDDPESKKSYFFPCQRWLATDEDDGQLMRTLVPIDKSLKAKLSKKDSFAIRKEVALETKAALDTYHVYVTTGDKFGAGTDATVHIVLFGEKDDTGEVVLKTAVNGNKNKFERNQTDEFVIESAAIGDIKKIRIGHDNKGGGGAWFLEKVEIDCPSIGKKWLFPCRRWLAKDEDDGLLERELFPQELDTEIYAPCIPYEVTTYTSDVRGSDTSADVYIVLYGKDAATQQKSLCTNKSERKKCFKRGQADKFVVELEDVGDTIEKIRIGHDGSGFGAGWHLDKVEIRRLNDSGKGSVTYTFPCGRWLARDEDDGAIERELTAGKITEEVLKKDGQVAVKQKQIKEQLSSKKYTVNVYTGDVSGAGTDANVFLTMYGEKGDSGERKLVKSETYSNKFERNQMDKFSIEAVDLGKLFKIKIRHDNANLSADWYLDRVEVVDSTDNDTYLFHCERWLSLKKDDKKLEKTLFVKGYEGNMGSSSTLKSLSRYGSSLSLDSNVTLDMGKSPRVTKRQVMAMDQVQEGPVIPYTVRVHTGSGEDNGTESHVWIRIMGPKKLQSEQIYLDLIGKRKFEPGSIESFSIEASDTKEVKQIEVGHDGVAPGSGWFLKQIELDVPTKGKTYVFACQQWLARDKGDGRTSRILSVQDGQSSVTSYKPLIPYEITVVTGDVQSAGTDAVLKLIAFGDNGTSGECVLEKSSERFERGRTDIFKIEIDDVAPLKKIRVFHDGKSSRPDWFLEKIELRSLATGDLYTFNCSQWLSKTLGEKKLSYDFPATVKGKQVIKSTTYKVLVKTSNVRGAGTDANVYVTLFGENGDTGPVHLKDSATFSKPFEGDQLDEFSIADVLSLGELTKCRVWHDNKGFGAAWHLEYIDVEDTKTKKKYHCECNKWLSKSDDDKQIVRELPCLPMAGSEGAKAGAKKIIAYEITVVTSDKKEAGMLHNVWLKLEGDKGTSKEFVVKNSAQEKLFRKGNRDTFTMESKSLGTLMACTLGAVQRADKHVEDKGGNSTRWHCYEVCVAEPGGGSKYVFPCNKWIDIATSVSTKHAVVLDCEDVKEGKVTAIRNMTNVKYQVTVVTGDIKGCGTNANVFITIYGEYGDTGQRALTQRFRDLFERNQVDKFEIEALDLGELTKIKVEHDNSGWNPGWYLERVEISNSSTSKNYVFPCQQWFDKKKGDGEISRELYAKDS